MTRPDLRLDLHVSEAAVESLRDNNTQARLLAGRATPATFSSAFSEPPI
jgi:hypothetical protein